MKVYKKWKCFLLALVFTFTLVMPVIPGFYQTAFATTEIFQNGSFEGTYANGVAPNWVSDGGYVYTATYSKEVSTMHSGSGAQKIDVTSVTAGAWAELRQEGINLTHGTEYTFSIWLKAATAGTNVHLALHKNGSHTNGDNDDYLGMDLTVGTTWKQYTLRGICPTDDTNGCVAIKLGSVCTLWVDDASLTVSNAMLANANMEGTYTNGVASGWTGGGYGTNTGTFSQESSSPFDGSSSQKVQITSYTDGAKYTTSTPSMSLTAGKTYKVGFYAKGTGNEVMQFCLRKNGSPYTQYLSSSNITLSSTWQYYEISGTVSATDNDVALVIALYSSGTLWVDNVICYEMAGTMLTDPNMEGAYTNGVASGWAGGGYGTNTGTFSQESSSPFEGSSSQKMQITSYTDGAKYITSSPSMTLTAGKTYKVGLFAKGTGGEVISYCLRESGSPYTQYLSSSNITLSSTWQYYEISGTVNATDNNAVLVIALYSAGTLWIDNVICYDQSENSLSNPSFELGVKSWPLVTKLDSGMEGTYINGVAPGWSGTHWGTNTVSWSKEATSPYEGSAAQRIDVTSYTDGCVTVNNEPQPFSIKKGKRYTVGMYLKGNNIASGKVRFYIRQLGSPYTEYLSTQPLTITNSWQYYELNGIVNSSDSNSIIMVEITGTGTLWIDKITCSEMIQEEVNSWPIIVREDGYMNEPPAMDYNSRPDEDTSTYVDGTKCLRTNLPLNSQMIVNSDYVSTNGGMKTFSIYLRTDSSSQKKVKLSIGWKTNAWGDVYKLSSDVWITNVWKRYSISGVIPVSDGNNYYVELWQATGSDAGAGDYNIYMDAAQLNNGYMIPFKTQKDVEVKVSTGNSQGIYYDGDSPKVTARLYNKTGNSVNVSTSWTFKEYNGRVVQSGSFNQSLNGYEAKDVDINLSPDKFSTYLFSITATANSIDDKAEILISKFSGGKSVIPAANVSPMGTHASFDDYWLERSNEIGANWFRIHGADMSTKWIATEKSQDVFTYYDSHISNVVSKGINILGSLDATPKWASSAPSGVHWYEAFSQPPANWTDWEDYVSHVVNHYKDSIHYWQVWNEPNYNAFWTGTNEQYFTLLQKAYTQTKNADSSAKVIMGPPTAGEQANWLTTMASLGANNYCDVVSTHLYPRDGSKMPDEQSPVSMDDEIKGIVNVVNNSYNGKEIWVTEFGPAVGTIYENEVYGHGGLSPDDGVNYLSRAYAIMMGNGVKRAFYYSMHEVHSINGQDGYQDLNEMRDGAVKPGSVAYNWMAQFYNNPVGCGLKAVDSNVKFYLFNVDMNSVQTPAAVLWNNSTTVDMKVKKTNAADVHDQFGNVINTDSNLYVPLSRMPIYLRGAGTNNEPVSCIVPSTTGTYLWDIAGTQHSAYALSYNRDRNGYELTMDGNHYLGGIYMEPFNTSDAYATYIVPTGKTHLKGTVGYEDDVLDTDYTDGAIFKIQRNGTEVWNSGVRTQTNTGLDFDVTVSPGDTIKIIVSPNGNNNSDHTMWKNIRFE